MLSIPLRFQKFIFCFVSCCILITLCLFSQSKALTSDQRISVKYDVFFEDTPTSSISRIAAPQFSNVFTPLDKTPIPHSVKRVWLRITIPAEQIERWRMNGFFPFMQFGGSVRRPTTLFYKPADQQRWQSFPITRCHIPLPNASKNGLAEYFLRIEGKPGIWFYPEITIKNTAMPTVAAAVLLWLLIGLTLGLAGLNFFLAVFTKAESCFWLCVYTLLTTGYYTFGFSPASTAGLNFTTAWTILLPGLALIILPHIGRNLFYQAACPRSIDAQLWGLSLLGVIVAIFPLIPGFSNSLHYLSLWPAVAALGAIPGIAAIAQKIAGGKRFTAGCLLTALGSAIALLPATSADTAGILQLMPFASVAMGLMILTPVALHGSELHVHDDITPDKSSSHVTSEKLIKKISHDLQSPLVTIASMAEQLNNITIPEEGRHALRTLQSATHVLQLQLKDLLDLNRADQHRLGLKKQSFDLQSLLKDAYHIMLPHTDAKGLTLSWKISPNLPIQYVGDPSRIIQILLNLLGNAARFSDSGKISVSVSCLHSTENTSQLLFVVKDQGRGIPLQNQYDVLDRFCQDPEQDSGRYCGSGLGLSVTTELVHLMNGFLCIESEPNVGTTISFTVRLEKFDKNKQVTSVPQFHAGLSLTPLDTEVQEKECPQLLIIETRTAPSDSLAEIISSNFFNIHEVHSFDEAVTTYEEFTADAVVVATELTEDAITILSQLLEIDNNSDQPQVPFIAIANSPVSAELLSESGYTEALLSPASEDELLTTLACLGLYTHPQELAGTLERDLDFDDDEYFDDIDETDLVTNLEPLSLTGLDIEPEPIALLEENIVQDETTIDEIEISSPVVKGDASLTIVEEPLQPESTEKEHAADTNDSSEASQSSIQQNDDTEGLADDVSTSLDRNDDCEKTEIPTMPLEIEYTEQSDEDVQGSIDEEFILEEIEEAYVENSTDTELPTPKLITSEEEAYLKEVLSNSAGEQNNPEQPDAFSDNNEDLLLDENQVDDHPLEEEENSINPQPLLSFDELDSEEDTKTIFERIAQERRTQEAQRRVTSDNHEAFNSITEDAEETSTWDDTPLTEAVSHLPLSSDEVSHPAEVLDSVFLPQIPKIISQLQETFEEASLLLEQDSMSGILHTAERLQEQAQKYALREIDKMASCVARAAEAQDQKAVINLMKELESTVVQTGKALRDIYKHSTDTTENV